MTRQPRGPGSVEQRIVNAERELFADLGLDVEEFFIKLGQTGAACGCSHTGVAPQWSCSTAWRSAPPGGRRCSPSFLSSGSLPSTCPVTARPIR